MQVNMGDSLAQMTGITSAVGLLNETLGRLNKSLGESHGAFRMLGQAALVAVTGGLALVGQSLRDLEGYFKRRKFLNYETKGPGFAEQGGTINPFDEAGQKYLLGDKGYAAQVKLANDLAKAQEAAARATAKHAEEQRKLAAAFYIFRGGNLVVPEGGIQRRRWEEMPLLGERAGGRGIGGTLSGTPGLFAVPEKATLKWNDALQAVTNSLTLIGQRSGVLATIARGLSGAVNAIGGVTAGLAMLKDAKGASGLLGLAGKAGGILGIGASVVGLIGGLFGGGAKKRTPQWKNFCGL